MHAISERALEWAKAGTGRGIDTALGCQGTVWGGCVTYCSSYSLSPAWQHGPWVLAQVGPLAVCEQSPALPPLQQISPLLA